MNKAIDFQFLKYLRIMGIVEGISTLILFFVAMPLKYLADIPLAVTICGSLHGLLFMGLVGMFFMALDKVPISLGLMIAGIVGAIIPFGPFIVDRWLLKIGEEKETKKRSFIGNTPNEP